MKDSTDRHEAVITLPAIIGGAAFACRCGAGEWFASTLEAEAAKTAHESGRGATGADDYLTAAAPDLLAALHGLSGVLADIEDEPECDAEILASIYQAREAIARAEGHAS